MTESYVNNLVILMVLLILDIIIGSFAIYYQSTKSKVIELLKIIDTINEDDLDNNPNIKESNKIDENVM